MLALSLALAVAGGGTLMGWKAPEARKVLIVDGEMHIEDITERAKMLMSTVEGIDPETVARNITILARQYQDPEAEFPDLAEDEGRNAIFGRAMRGAFDLVILDNFSTLATVEDENAASAFDPVIKFLLKMKQAGIATILVHHSNKTGKEFRGSSKLSTTFEVIMGLLKITSGEHRHGAAFDLEWTKFSQGAGMRPSGEGRLGSMVTRSHGSTSYRPTRKRRNSFSSFGPVSSPLRGNLPSTLGSPQGTYQT